MWKKIGIILVATIGFAFSVLALDNKLFAADVNVYNAGGSVTGRVNIAPNGISGSNIGLQKGDKLSTGVNNGWILVDYQTYDKYNCTSSLTSGTITCPAGNSNINAWLALTTSAISKTNAGLVKEDYLNGMYLSKIDAKRWYRNGDYSKTLVSNEVDQFNNVLKNSASDYQLITFRNFTSAQQAYDWHTSGAGKNNSVAAAELDMVLEETSVSAQLGRAAFPPEYVQIKNASYSMYYISNISSNNGLKDFIFDDNVWTSYFYNNGTSCLYTNFHFTSAGTFEFNRDNAAIDQTFKASVRPNAYLDTKDIVFAISQGSTESVGVVTEPILSPSYTSLYDEMKIYGEMKPRIYNTDYNISFNNIKNEKGEQIDEVNENGTILLDATANNFNNSTLSVLMFDYNTNNLKYYKPLATANGLSDYSFEITGIPSGKYKIAVVNELYDNLNSSATYSSYLSDVKELEIVSPISNLSFSSNTNLKYSSNVNISDLIGTISSSNGAGSPVYTLVADSAHANDVDNFELDSDGKTIKVKGASLDARTYYFKIQAQDANGDPQTPLEISAQITVSKATTTVSFDTTTNTVKTMAQAQTSWNETATSTPSNSDLKITYDISGGDVGVITIDPDTGAITPTSSDAKGKVTIRATVDDDPSTGKDNYESASTTKDMIIIDGVI